MTAAEALNKLVDHLLGENWYSIYTNHEDVYKDIVDTICSRYRGKKEDRVTQWRRRLDNSPRLKPGDSRLNDHCSQEQV